MRHIESLSLDEAQRLIAAGRRKAEDIGSPSAIAVVDAGGHLLAFARMDEAILASVDIAINKAFTSLATHFATGDLADQAKPGGPFFGLQTTNQGRIVVFGGGIPLKHGKTICGAVGVSGGTVEQDEAVAAAAAGAFQTD